MEHIMYSFSVLIIGLVFLYLYLTEKNTYLGFLSGSWMIWGTKDIVFLFSSNVNLSRLLLHILWIFSGYLLSLGIASIQDQTSNNSIKILSLLACFGIIISIFYPNVLLFGTAIRPKHFVFLYLAIVYLDSGIRLIHTKLANNQSSQYLSGWSLIINSAVTIPYLFYGPGSRVALIAYPVTYILSLFVGIGLLLTHYQIKMDMLVYLSEHDNMTRLYNRAFFDQKLNHFESNKNLVGIIIGDLDGLKRINDLLGHQVGDQYIIDAAAIMQRSISDKQILSRNGGDEFAILVPDCTVSAIQDICSRIKNNLYTFNQSHPGIPLNISLGWAIKTDKNRDIREVLKEADRKMYEDKANNAITSYKSE